MSIDYQGHDPIPTIINNYFYHSRKKENAKVLNSFKHQINFRSISEDVIFFSSVESEYNYHTEKHYVKPNSEEINLYSEEQIIEGKKTISRPGEFCKSVYEFPKKETFRQINCRCGSGIVSCPNCKSTKIVTCPNCYGHRSGKCNGCAGSGRVECQGCSGSGKCQKCYGSCEMQCPNCQNGYVTKYRDVQKTCSRCHGSGRVDSSSWNNMTGSFQNTRQNCTFCVGGYTTSQESYRVQDSYCNGTGRVTCNKCSGSGKCGNCGGSGTVKCKNCGGNGLCRFCSGHGTKTCPTCTGNGKIYCPICEGTHLLNLYSSDLYHYDYIVDSKATFPTFYDGSKHAISDKFAGSLETETLEDSSIESSLGMFNDQIRNTASAARANFDGLLQTAKKREFDKNDPDDLQGQDRVYSAMLDVLDSNWSGRSDSFHEKFLVGFSENDRESQNYSLSDAVNVSSYDENVISAKILFQEYNHLLVPVTETNLEIDDKPMTIIGQGIKKFHEFVISENRAEEDFAQDLTNRDTSRIISPPKVEEKTSILRTIATLGTQKIKKINKLVILVGDDEVSKLSIFTTFGNVISKMNLGQINDHMYNQTVSNFLNPERYGIGSSTACSILVDEQKTIVLVNIHASSYLQEDPEVIRMIGASDMAIYVTKDIAELQGLQDSKMKNKIIAVLVDEKGQSIKTDCLKTLCYSKEQIEKQFHIASSEKAFYNDFIEPMMSFLFGKLIKKSQK